MTTNPSANIANCYIAGPMTGYVELNFPLFHAVTAHYRALGWHVVNPAEINADPAAGWLTCMRQDIKQLVDCDTIVMLPGWSSSRGASLEYHIALHLGMHVVHMDPPEDERIAKWYALGMSDKPLTPV